MRKLHLIVVILCFLPFLTFGQDATTIIKVKTVSGEVKIPGNWQQLNTMDDSGQTYLKNDEGVIIAIAQNPKRHIHFFRAKKQISRT